MLMKKNEKSERYIHAQEVAELLEVPLPTAYEKVRGLNKELKEKGFITIAGKCPRSFFNEKFYDFSEKE